MHLFNNGPINEFFSEHLRNLKDQIDYEYTLDIEKRLFIEKYLLNYNLNNLNVDIEKIKGDREEIQENIESSNGTSIRAKFIKITLEIPFQGRSEYFAMIPSKLLNKKNPDAYFKTSLRAVYLPFKFSTDEDSEKISKDIEQSKEEILYNITCVNNDIDKFNDDLENKIKEFIEEKHDSLIKSKEILDKLNIPIRNRDEVSPFGLTDIRINDGQINISNSNLDDLFILNYVKNPQDCRIIKADNNHISEIKYLDRFVNLIELNLGRNRIKRINGLNNLKNLEILKLYGNNVEKIENLDDLENLRELNLDYNSIINISGLDNLETLEVLSLTYNKIDEAYGFENLINLCKLNLNESLVKKIGSIGFLDKLNELWIHNHELPKTLVEDLGGISDTGRVDNLNLWKAYCRGDYVIYNNHIYTAYIDSLSKKLGLVLGHLEITDLSDVKRLNGLTNLQELYLWNNKIKEILNIDNLISLEKLDLSKNEIEIIKGLDTLKNLKNLTISENNIKEIQGLENLPELTGLILAKNKIKKLSGLNLMKNLKELNLSSNKISKIENIGNLESLIELDLSNNLLSKIESLNNNKLELDLSNNLLSKIESLNNNKFEESNL